MKKKISANTAWAMIAQHANNLGSVTQKLEESLGLVVARDIVAPISLPPFDNSAVDGFALAEHGNLEKSVQVIGTIAAGEAGANELKVGQASHIMTGAKIPKGTLAVVMQENVERVGDFIQLRCLVDKGAHIRRAGEDIRVAARVVEKGTVLASKHIGVLSALGINEIEVIKRPSVGIVSTGSELIDPGQPLGNGEVYFCTGPMISSLCHESGVSVLFKTKVADNEEAIERALLTASKADIIIMVGGMAGGKFDFGRPAFERIGVAPLFFEGEWRPGKPLFFGKLGSKIVFGLPGNPVAAFVMFKVFIEPAIAALKGKNSDLCWKKGHLKDLPKLTDKSQFLRVNAQDSEIKVLDGQGSHQLYSLSKANGIAWLPPNFEHTGLKEVLYLPLEA